MGEMGRQKYDGSYAEYKLVPAKQIIPLKKDNKDDT
jgi:threonine dehydrogenase-like Zn-dependent dehydrogenase